MKGKKQDMKNTSKKSKFVILPALATLVLTGVASVTGTVAWFTANRAVTVGNKFETKVLDGDLKVAITKGVGISDDEAADHNVTANVDGFLTHGSYNAVAGSTGSLYVANLDDSGKVDGYSDRGTVTAAVEAENAQTSSKWFAGTSAGSHVWYGVSWTMKFTTTNQTKDTIALQFDPTGSSATDTTTGCKTIKGLRIAFMTSEKLIIASGDKASVSDEKTPSSSLKHVVSATEEAKTGNFDSSIFYKIGDQTATVALANDYDSDMTSRKTYLGDVGTDGLSVTVVAWFEGEDASISDANKNALSSVTTSLRFYARRYENKANA